MDRQVELMYWIAGTDAESDGESELAPVSQGNAAGSRATHLHSGSLHHDHKDGADPATSGHIT